MPHRRHNPIVSKSAALKMTARNFEALQDAMLELYGNALDLEDKSMLTRVNVIEAALRNLEDHLDKNYKWGNPND